MDNLNEDVQLKQYSTFGDGKAIIEILNIGFEPLLLPEEYISYCKIGEIRNRKRDIRYGIQILEYQISLLDDYEDVEEPVLRKWLSKVLRESYEFLKKEIDKERLEEERFRSLLKENVSKTRSIFSNRKFKNEDQFRNIAIFESDLTRTFGCKDMDHCDDIVSVVTYYTEIFESIIHNGFNYKDRHFVFFTAGAGQTRCKKSTFVSEDKLNEHSNKLMCGLTREMINEQGGMNTNKYLAYTSLCQSNTEIWKEFDIDKAIVVEDIEYVIPNQTVRYIYTESPEDKEAVTIRQKRIKELTELLKEFKEQKKQRPKGTRRSKKVIADEKAAKKERKELQHEIDEIYSKYHSTTIRKQDVIIPFTDGFGISLKKMNSSMIRLPFIKGLIAYVPKRAFINYCSRNNLKLRQITDIYGKPHNIENIDYILTKSQFKMWNFYRNVTDESGDVVKTGWEVYKENFKKYDCTACRCNVENDVKLNAKTNYQVLQTLTTEMTNKEIYQLAKSDIDDLNGIGQNVQSMLNVLAANPDKNDNLSYFQKSLLLYPEMLKDHYVKNLLKNTKDSLITKLKSGKFNINGAYTFAIPDPLACLQWWFTGERDLDKLGFLKEGEISCTLFDNGEEVDCLRSPHLDHAHCIRRNVVNSETKTWTKSKGIYISVKDIMSKLLMYDNDGDKLLVHNNQVIINCAKRYQKKYGMIPNYYDMPKAKPEELTNTSLFNGIVLAYHHGNIGTPSNEITKIFKTLNPQSTKEEIEEAIEIVALRCVDVNFTIDFAKTLYKPTIPQNVINRYKKYSGKKVPHFFIYAKGKLPHQVEELGQCNIDRIDNIVPNKRIVFKNFLGKYSYKTLMYEPDTDINNEKAQEIIELYHAIHEANIRKLSYLNLEKITDAYEKDKIKLQLEFDATKQRQLFKELVDRPGEYISEEYITDVLVKALRDDVNKDTLWRLFGEVIFLNIEKNLIGLNICQKCQERFEVKPKKNGTYPIYCNSCMEELKRNKERQKKYNQRLKNRKS